MTKIRDRPAKETTREAPKFMTPEPIIKATYAHALKFYQERQGIAPEDLKRELILAFESRDDPVENPEPIRLIAEYVNERLLDQLTDRYGFKEKEVIEAVKAFHEKMKIPADARPVL